MVFEHCGRFFGRLLRVARELFDPDDADTDIGIGKFIDNRRLHRPGALHTSAGSGGREQSQKTGALPVAVKAVLKGL